MSSFSISDAENPLQMIWGTVGTPNLTFVSRVFLIPIMYLLTQKDGQPALVDELAETADGEAQAEISSPSQNE